MVRQIIRKEILENLLSLRFVLSLILVIPLFAAGGFMYLGKYKQQSQDYWKETNKNLSSLEERSNQLYKLVFYKQTVRRKPKPLSFCAEGFEKFLPNYFKFNVFMMHYPDVKDRSNFMLLRFADIDWVFTFSLVLSFVALLLTYNSICGEKEMGTLRLILAGSLPRYEVLLGKYFGAMFTLIIPLLLGLLVNLIIITSSNVVVIHAMEWLKIIIIVLLSILYLSIFVLLGILVSSRISSSANSMLVSLLLWVGLIILIPSSGRLVSYAFLKVPTQVELRTRTKEVVDGIIANAFAGKYGENALVYNPDLKSPDVNPPARARFQKALSDTMNQVREKHINMMVAQALIGRRFTCISPSVIYQRASEAICGTGIGRWANLYQQIGIYRGLFEGYVRSKDQDDPNSLHLFFGIEGEVSAWGAISKKSSNFVDVPKFQERDMKLGQSFRNAMLDIGVLMLFNLVFFSASFVSFLLYDVR